MTVPFLPPSPYRHLASLLLPESLRLGFSFCVHGGELAQILEKSGITVAPSCLAMICLYSNHP